MPSPFVCVKNVDPGGLRTGFQERSVLESVLSMTAAVGVMGAVGVDAGVFHHVLHRLDHGFARGLGVVAEIKRHGVLTDYEIGRASCRERV